MQRHLPTLSSSTNHLLTFKRKSFDGGVCLGNPTWDIFLLGLLAFCNLLSAQIVICGPGGHSGDTRNLITVGLIPRNNNNTR